MDVTLQSVSCLKSRKVLMNGVCGNLSALIQRRATMLIILIREETLDAMWQERVAQNKRDKTLLKKTLGFFFRQTQRRWRTEYIIDDKKQHYKIINNY